MEEAEEGIRGRRPLKKIKTLRKFQRLYVAFETYLAGNSQHYSFSKNLLAWDSNDGLLSPQAFGQPSSPILEVSAVLCFQQREKVQWILLGWIPSIALRKVIQAGTRGSMHTELIHFHSIRLAVFIGMVPLWSYLEVAVRLRSDETREEENECN